MLFWLVSAFPCLHLECGEWQHDDDYDYDDDGDAYDDDSGYEQMKTFLAQVEALIAQIIIPSRTLNIFLALLVTDRIYISSKLSSSPLVG